MAGVYRAWDSELLVWRAVKVLLPEYAKREGLRQRFEREAAAMALLEHPHVIRVYDVVTDEALPYMVMELAEGGNLVGWLKCYGSMPAALACSVLTQVASGLGAAHAAGVIHRDVKPHNVLISDVGDCKLTDFGIARVPDPEGGEAMTRTGSTMGTIGYMAPEQRSDAKQVDARADIYSLGAMLYKLLTGSIVSDLFLVEHEPSLLEEIPEPLHELIIKACFHDRDRRFPDTEAFVSTLMEIRGLLPPDPRDTPPLPIPVQGEAPDDGAAEPFPEIAVLVTHQQATPEPAPAAKVLPYRMPEVPPAARDLAVATPSWLMERVDAPPSASMESTSPAALRHPEAPSLPPVVDFESETVPPVVRVEVAPGPAPAAADLLEPPSKRRRFTVIGLAVAAILAWVVLLLSCVAGSLALRSSQLSARTAQESLYEVLETERTILADLGRLGARQGQLQHLDGLYERFELAEGEPARIMAAAAYVRALQAQEDALSGAGPSRDLVRARTQRVRASLVAVAEAQESWRWWAGTIPGRLAIGLRTAPAAPH